MRLLSMLLACSLVACGGPDDPADGPDAGAPDAAGPNTVGGCAADALDRCDYAPATYAPGNTTTVDLGYTDVTGAMRTFEIAVRVPAGAPEPLPVVVWSHGGAEGRNNALAVGLEWAAVLVGAGYLVVDIAHPPRDPASRAALCTALEVAAADCPFLQYLHWDRPHEVKRVLDFIEVQAASGPFAGRIDARHIVYAGHSAGAGAVEMINGAVRTFGDMPTTLDDPRPVAFLGNSVEPPGDDGYTETSFGAMARPMLINSGIGDDTSVFGEDRSRVFDLMPAGDKYRLFILAEAARHETFDQSDDSCTSWSTGHGVDPTRCPVYRSWITSAGLAFVDAYARGSADARAYLASDNLAVLAGGGATWSRK